MITIGIDPDLKGGVVVIAPDGHIAEYWPIPSVNTTFSGNKPEMDAVELNEKIRALANWLLRGQSKPFRIFIEEPPGMPGQRGLKKQSRNYGLICGLLIAHGLKGFIEVHPATWQAAMFDLKDVKERAGNVKNPGAARKKLKLEIGRRIIKQELGLDTDHPGIIDAALIALWGRGKG